MHTALADLAESKTRREDMCKFGVAVLPIERLTISANLMTSRLNSRGLALKVPTCRQFQTSHDSCNAMPSAKAGSERVMHKDTSSDKKDAQLGMPAAVTQMAHLVVTSPQNNASNHAHNEQ